MTHDTAHSSVADNADQILQFMRKMHTLGQRLDAATSVWELDLDKGQFLRSADVWSTRDTNSRLGLRLARLGRSKAVLDLFDHGRLLKGLEQEVSQTALDAVESLSDDVQPLIELEVQLSRNPTNPSDHVYRDAFQSVIDLQTPKVEMLRIVPELKRLVQDLDRTAARRRRQRRLARVWHPLLQFVVLLGIGVVAVDIVSDRLSSAGSLWVWSFAVASFVAVDYVLEPWLCRYLDRRATELLQRELDATHQVVAYLPKVLGLLAALVSTVPGAHGLLDRIVSMLEQFVPKAEAVLALEVVGTGPSPAADLERLEQERS